ncbi:MAG: hypothetical protein KGN34_12375 [Sphingomonadales bacterium]|nr:hypothetical protein [Sphingomonadales bacterium]
MSSSLPSLPARCRPDAAVTTGAEQWRDRARGLRAEQRMVEADAAIARAASLDPSDRLTAFLRAQSAYELGFPAGDLYAHARRLWPDNPDIIRNHALALTSQGDVAGADRLLADALVQSPDWLDGHRVLSGMRFARGDGQHHDASFAAAVQACPRHQGLWLGWFSTIAQQRDWPRAAAILDAAAAALGETRPIAIARAFLASESGDLAVARERLAALADVEDDFLALCRIRTALRGRDPRLAESLALPLTRTRLAGQVWPYLSTCWRLLGDARAQWLDGDPVMGGEIDPGFSPAELGELAALLRSLHTMQAPYPEQSVRGGTQTDRSVLLRHEPLLIDARARLLEGVRRFIATLPAPDPTHPVLSRPRDNLRVSGSWSVRLGAGGYNVTHSHPVGWLSCAFYVALPEDIGAAPAGHLHLGAPPPELGLDLAAYTTIAPQAGRMVVFPSIAWHGTVPFPRGERLNIAFDVVPVP